MAASQPEYSPEELHELLSGLMPEIPGYRVLRLLGRGGMSYVYLGVQQSLDRQVAIKVIQPEALRDEISKLRFEREAQIIAKLQHPCIVGIYEIGRTEHGLLYYVLPYLARGHLGQRDMRGDQHGIVEVLRALLWALDYAHGRGVVHRDVKAENVLFDNADRPLLTDFGIALSRRDRSRVTGRGLAVGSGAHMAPEQARGESVDGRADLYSLGVLTYEMLTGYLPYKNSDPLGLALMHAVDPVPPMPAALVHWQPLIDRAMAKIPDQRFADAREMMVALDEVEAAIHRLGLPQPEGTRQSWLALGDWARAARQHRAAAPVQAVVPPAAEITASPGLPARLQALASESLIRTRLHVQRLRGLWPALSRQQVLALAGGALGLIAIALLGALWPAAPPLPTRPAQAAPGEDRPAIITPSRPEALASAAPGARVAAPPAGGASDAAESPATEITDGETPDPLAELSADARMLAFASEQISRRRLSQPPGDNAYESLLAAEALSADPQQLGALGAAWLDAATPYIASAVAEGRDEAAQSLLQRGRELTSRLGLQQAPEIEALREALAPPLILRLQQLLTESDAAGLRGLKARIRSLALPSDWFEPEWSRKLVLAKPGEALAEGWRLLRLPTAERPGLAMQASPVSRSAYAAFATQTGRPAANCRIRTAVMTLRKRSWQDPEFAQQGDHPVVCVSHADALAFAAWQAQRSGLPLSLPAAADWQRYAAHPGGRCDQGAACALEGTRTGAAGAASALGIRSSQGNVREWLAAAGSPAGESWRDLAEPNHPRRNAEADPQRGYDDVGFRLVREVPLNELEVQID